MLTKDAVNMIDFGSLETKFSYADIGWEYLRSEPGREHYKLLAYLSMRFNNRDIFDIGTHNGSSAVALSHNPANKVYSFDINKRDFMPKIDNVTYTIADIWDNDVRADWQERLLGSAFIFLDIDPHEGMRELEFYHWLKRMGYKGFILCDDIHFFKEMKENFWQKIPDVEKSDVTHIGHWSGTGIIHFGDLHAV